MQICWKNFKDLKNILNKFMLILDNEGIYDTSLPAELIRMQFFYYYVLTIDI